MRRLASPLNSWSFLNDLLNHAFKELNVKEALKSPFFVVQKAAAPNKNGIAMNRKDRRSCNAALPAKSKMANRGTQNGQQDPERGLPQGTTFAN